MNVDGERDLSDARVVKFETLKQQQERKNKRRRAFYITLAAAAALSFFVVVFTVFLKVGKIEINGCSVYNTDELIAALPVAVDDSLYGFDGGKAEQSLLKQFPYLKTVSVSRRLPSTVVIDVTEEAPVFRIKAGSDNYLLSEDFKVLSRTDIIPEGTGLVELETGYVKRCVTGETLSFAGTKLINTLDELWRTLCYYELDDKINYVNAANRFDIYLGYEGRLRIYIGDIDDCDTKIRFFIGIMEHIYDDQFGLIDISNPREATFSPDLYDTSG